MPTRPSGFQVRGTMTALVTPFRDGRVDFDRLRDNVRWQIDHGIDALVPVGTTGESPTLTHEEHRQVVSTVVEAAAEHGRGRVKVIAGAGSNSTHETIDFTRHARKVGADAVLLVNPYYNKPTQEGLYRHFMAVADEVGIPIVLYNIPGRTGVALSPQTTARLAEHPLIVAVKEATGSLDNASEVAALCGERLAIVSGDDSLTLPLMAIGATGVISVLANLLPDRVKAMVQAAEAGDYESARRMHFELFPLFKGMLTLATNPIPIKAALKLAGRDTGELRLPLCEMDVEQNRQLKAMLEPFDIRAAAALR